MAEEGSEVVVAEVDQIHFSRGVDAITDFNYPVHTC